MCKYNEYLNKLNYKSINSGKTYEDINYNGQFIYICLKKNKKIIDDVIKIIINFLGYIKTPYKILDLDCNLSNSDEKDFTKIDIINRDYEIDSYMQKCDFDLYYIEKLYDELYEI